MRAILTDVARSVICVPVYECVLGSLVNINPAKTDEPIEMPIGSRLV